MRPNFTIRAAAAILALTLSSGAAFGQREISGGGYVETREQLRELLQQYPPKLGEVLQADPSLLSSEDYLAPYPELLTFLKRHPEVRRDPHSFLRDLREPDALHVFGDDNIQVLLQKNHELQEALNQFDQFRPETQSAREWRSAIATLTITSVFFIAVAIIGWIARTVIDYRRWLRVSKIQAEAHSKLMDRFSTNEELLAYLQTPAGKRFFELSYEPPDPGTRPSAPVARILWSVQLGIALLVGGLAVQFLILSGQIHEGVEPLGVFSMVAMAVGASFLIGAAVSYNLSEKLGLLRPAARATEARRGDGPATP